ncbi:hemin ABC transporter substrate-binding protein [Arcanobacterium canis]|uniref:ABC transporter substrate-binding protein n=1 Tax=Arcanobacterium canis TaxID=999183 RepID=A0ABY8G184_9ACTO|nr:ABC transporter substrate-binding protein [Arcanobacterium canis]WFM83096.1 ABC transporter substrate-binding protein [Arcanobacterium canis]
MHRLRLAALALTVLILAGCSANPLPAHQPSSPSSAARSSSSPRLPDPRSLSGVSEVADIAQPRPIEGNFSQKLPVTVKDYEGNMVKVSDTSRILALDINGTLSRTIISLGLGKSIIGRSISSTESSLAKLPVVTENGHQLNAEAIISLRPSVVLADRSVGPPEVLDQIRAAGIPLVLVSPDRKIHTTRDFISTVAHALGVDEAGKALVQRTEKEIEAAREQIAQWKPRDPLNAAFLYVRGNAGVFFLLGSKDGATELIEGVGARDVTASAGITSVTPASAEALISVNPEVIFVMRDGLKSTGGIEGLMARPGVAQTRAGQKKRVISIPDGISLSFGPQTGDILLAVARAMYGVPTP